MNVETDVNPNYFFKNIFDSIFVSYSNELHMFKKKLDKMACLTRGGVFLILDNKNSFSGHFLFNDWGSL